MPADAIIGKDFDAGSYVARLKRHGVDSVVFFGKCHYGHAYYPSEIGVVHPGLQCDMFGDISAACQEQEVELVGYMSVFYDTCVGAQFPEWRKQSTSDELSAGFDSGNFTQICVNSPYLTDHFLPQCKELLQRYPMQELLLDTMTGFQPCYCKHCVKKFGGAIPENEQDEQWSRYVHWYRECYENFFAFVINELHAIDPSVHVMFNWNWSFKQPEVPPKNVQHLLSDLIPSGSVSFDACRYFAGTGLPFEYMCGRFLHGLGDWSNGATASLRIAAAEAVANGGSFYLIDRQLPDGSLEDRSYNALDAVFPWLQERKNMLLGSSPVAEIAVLWDTATIYGDNLDYYPQLSERKERIRRYEGLCKIMRENGQHFTALNSERLRATLAHYRVLILPEVCFIDSETKSCIATWVQNGGQLLLVPSRQEEELDADLLALAGVQSAQYDKTSFSYFESAAGEAIAVMVPLLRFTVQASAETVVHSYDSDATSDKSYGHGLPPPTTRSETPWAVVQQHGSGSAAALACPVCSLHADFHHPYVAQRFLDVLDRLLPDPLVRISTPAQVSMSVLRQGDDLMIHLVNHSAKEHLAGHWFPVIDYLPTISDIHISVRGGGVVQRIPEKTSCVTIHDIHQGRQSFVADDLIDLGSYRIVNYFEESKND